MLKDIREIPPLTHFNIQNLHLKINFLATLNNCLLKWSFVLHLCFEALEVFHIF